jgi:hypothetical protein
MNRTIAILWTIKNYTNYQYGQYFFHAYNSCDINKQALIYGESLEFYHDKGGLTTSKQEHATNKISVAK